MFWNKHRSSNRQAENTSRTPHETKLAADLASLVDLPLELIAQIVSELSFKTLLVLRLTSRAHNTLVTNDEILRRWGMINVDPISLRLATPPSQHIWAYLVDRQRSWHIAHTTAFQIMDYMVRKILLLLFLRTRQIDLPMTSYRRAQMNLRTPRVTENMTKELATRLFMLGQYLRSCRNRLVGYLAKLSQTDDWDFLNRGLLGTCLASSEHYASFSAGELEDVHITWMFICGVLRGLTERPHYLGTLEAILEGINQKPLGDSSLALSLVIGGLTIIRSLLQSRNFCTRKKLVLRSLSGLTEDVQHRLTNRGDDLEKLDLHYSPMNSLWVDGMLSELIMRGLPADNVVMKGTSRTTITLLKDLAGFDIFAQTPGEDPDVIVGRTDMYGAPA